ncbi:MULTISPECIES: hypothetical protein [Pseudomonas]|uniref:Uncharacterized protein n=1 Tax=Pseudomonas putida (strain ATCC 47054 / DSM 6125 / CFBP 8728 / NCIMB 11950 / KT2440) TaxID=160488 RepID=Q88IG9_PSEPK|nr:MULTISPECIES: hypothetical protein [Pseudomonas]AAN68638.1 conserved exported protein of unknown function [Pseudomonas putida KT2440]KMU97702.1 hypothetical protein AC138_00520 [Pseudomonas putida]KMY35283.1 hypothetical protein AA993_15480 [Pseudomonas putida]MDD2080924.1 hypothetical protein [Pseudomonas putida]PXZ53331.1 hypothetical protein DM483_04670 [Pseudomonas sp. SMT-1]
MTTQQVIALIVISAFIVGLYAYAYFLGKKAGRAHHLHGLLLDLPSNAASRFPIMGIPPQVLTPEGSGHATAQDSSEATPASLREVRVVEAQKTKSLCCEAAGIIPPISSPAEALIPHNKLREAPPADATLIAKSRPHAQPAVGYTHPSAASCIEAAMDATLAEQNGTYATSGQMAQAIEAALQQAGFLFPADPSYQSIPMTRSDYDLLINAAETLRLAVKTWKALPGTEPGCKRTMQQLQDIQALAMRVHFKLRSTPVNTTVTGEAA